MLLAFLFLAQFAPVTEKMEDDAAVIVHARVETLVNGDISAIIHDAGSYDERIARLKIIGTLKGDLKSGEKIYLFWSEGGKVPLAKARLKKDREYFFFLSTPGGNMGAAYKEAPIYRPLDPIVGSIPYDSWTESLMKDHLNSH